MKAIVMTRAGGLDALSLQDLPEPVPGPGEVLVEIAAAGVNFMDVGARRGTVWKDLPNPKILGVEGAGRVLALGPDVVDLEPGQRVAWVYAPGSYAERIVIPAEALVPIPDEIDDATAAATMMQGLTASHFAREFYPIRAGETALVHAAAGGLGLLITQIAKLREGIVIGRVSSEEKVAVAKAAGADHVIVDSDGNFAAEVLRVTEGRGVDVVYDGSGPATFADSMASLARNGTFAWFGPVLGAPAPIEVMALPRSIKIGYPVFLDHIHTPELLRAHTAQLFKWIAKGRIQILIGATYPLADAARAHADMESRLTTGKLVLVP